MENVMQGVVKECFLTSFLVRFSYKESGKEFVIALSNRLSVSLFTSSLMIKNIRVAIQQQGFRVFLYG